MKLLITALITLASLMLLSCDSSKPIEQQSDNPDPVKREIPDSLLRSIHLCTEMPLKQDSVKQLEGPLAGVLSSKRWAWSPGVTRVLNIAFVDGKPDIQEKVKTYSKEWERSINIRFVYVDNVTDADIRISFAQEGSWSFIGIDAISEPVTMNFGWLEGETVDSLFRGVVLHEFGHALGLVHEHQLAGGNPIQWDKDIVYAYYMRPPNKWSKEEVDLNIFSRYSQDQLIGGTYDEKSIMLYYIPRKLTLNGYSTPLNTRLSDQDKIVMSNAYRR